ncbi:hypothetical protein TIFTF001_028214 [Ficus carica]|uniref:Uncharacterized protein n=1 Tax=Ficus carica TaxID=3494 RepID=A0AA88DPI1_FICCA|nr:hypothetical protein TIFTF001_028214 [Ficus carica]
MVGDWNLGQGSWEFWEPTDLGRPAVGVGTKGGKNLVRSSVLTGFNSVSGTANPNKSHMLGNAMKNAMVSSLAVTLDARWRAWIGGL